MLKLIQIAMLPTEKSSKIFVDKVVNEEEKTYYNPEPIIAQYGKSQHLYFLSDEKIFEDADTNISGIDNALQGLIILNKYARPIGHMPGTHRTLCAAEHDEIFSLDIDNVLEDGLTQEDAKELARLNWRRNEDCDCFSHFV